MVRPTVCVTGVTKSETKKSVKATNSDLAKKMLGNAEFKNKVLLNTANRWAKKYQFSGNLELGSINESGKSFKLKVDSKETKKFYSFCGKGAKTFMISPSVFRRG